jgi:hypothetical protein
MITEGASAELPPALAEWSQSLAGLQVSVAIALGPILLRLDELVGRQGGVQGPDGDPDGFDGLIRRGSPERLLIGEWLLAEEIPDEFLRRAAEGELLHLAPGYRHDPPHGVVRVLVDAGPGQLGAGRLVQFAALIVLHRRAARLGATLQVGVLGTAAGRWLTGELPELLRVWLRSRRSEVPSWDDVRAWASAEDSTEGPATWLFCAPDLVRGLAPGERSPITRRRILTSREGEWDSAGVRTVDVTLAGEHLTLSLPVGPAAIRALRGEGFRRGAPSADRDEPGGDVGRMRYPMFPGAPRCLVGRGVDRSELIWVRIPQSPTTSARRPKRRRFDGTVFGVGAMGARIVVLLARGADAEIHVIGRHLNMFRGTTVPLRDLGLDPELSTVNADGPLAPILYDAGTLLCRFADGWYRITGDGEASLDPEIEAALASGQTDQPLIAVRSQVVSQQRPVDEVVLLRHGTFFGASVGASIRLSRNGLAWSVDETRWVLRCRNVHHRLTVATGAEVLAMVEVNNIPGLITRSAAGLVLRLVQPDATRTLTAWSNGDPQMPAAVHPTLPLIAVVAADGSVEIVDLTTETAVLRVPATSLVPPR